MWIRSQNKEMLMNCNSFRIGSIFKENEILASVGDKTYVFGQYSTKEKAMEVLDDIYFRIRYSDIDEVLYYQMHADDEVEV